MAKIDSKEVKAGQLLCEQIEQSAWFQNGITKNERRVRIDQEMEAWWHLKMMEKAMHQLMECDTHKARLNGPSS